MQPTAAMSPSLNFLTALPTFTTRPDNFVARNTGIYGRHDRVPFVAHLVQIRMTDAAI